MFKMIVKKCLQSKFIIKLTKMIDRQMTQCVQLSNQFDQSKRYRETAFGDFFCHLISPTILEQEQLKFVNYVLKIC